MFKRQKSAYLCTINEAFSKNHTVIPICSHYISKFCQYERFRWGNFTGNRMGTGIDSPTYTFSAKFPFTDFAIPAIPHPKTIICTMRNEHQWQTIRNGSPILLPTFMRILCVRFMPPTHLARFPYPIYRQTGKGSFCRNNSVLSHYVLFYN